MVANPGADISGEARSRSQRALADASAEGEQLKAMISALREELEAREQAHETSLQEQRQTAVDEAKQLQATVGTIRDELEAMKAEHAAALQDAERLHREEVRQLQSTIRNLRAQMEERARD